MYELLVLTYIAGWFCLATFVVGWMLKRPIWVVGSGGLLNTDFGMTISLFSVSTKISRFLS